MDQPTHWAWRAAGWLVPVALLLFLVTTNVRFAANSLWLYEALFERHEVAATSGLSPAELRSVGSQIRDYFNSDREPLSVTLEMGGVERELFGPDETAHMADVKALFQRTFRTQEASGAFLLVAGIAAAAVLRRRAVPVVGLWLWRGGLLTLGVIVALGIASVVAFGPLFTAFHYLGFPQGNWQFDPRTDYLVRVFPMPFWQDMTLFIGLLTVLQAAVLTGLGFWAGRALTGAARARRRQHAGR